jgi:hypothetical protein
MELQNHNFQLWIFSSNYNDLIETFLWQNITVSSITSFDALVLALNVYKKGFLQRNRVDDNFSSMEISTSDKQRVTICLFAQK